MLFLRHGEKQYRNGQSPTLSLDPDLTPSGREAARDRFQQLALSEGAPALLIASPYRRTWETALLAQEAIAKVTGVTVPLVAELALAEYLGNRRRIDSEKDFHPHTCSYGPLPVENWGQYQRRVKRYRPNASGWYITHGLVIQTLAQRYGVELPHPPPLGGIRITDGTLAQI
jgi:broad specificity phosphatase PhoE